MDLLMYGFDYGRRKTKEQLLQMQNFGTTPPKKIMSEMLVTNPKKIPLNSAKAAELEDQEDIELIPVTQTIMNKGHRMESMAIIDNQNYQQMKDPTLHEFENVNKHFVAKLPEESSSMPLRPALQVSFAATFFQDNEVEKEESFISSAPNFDFIVPQLETEVDDKGIALCLLFSVTCYGHLFTLLEQLNCCSCIVSSLSHF